MFKYKVVQNTALSPLAAIIHIPNICMVMQNIANILIQSPLMRLKFVLVVERKPPDGKKRSKENMLDNWKLTQNLLLIHLNETLIDF